MKQHAKRILTLLLALLLALSALTACGGGTTTPAATEAPAEATAEPTAEPEVTAEPAAEETHTAYPITENLYFYFGTPMEQTFESVPERVIAYGQDMIDMMVYFGLADKIVGVCTRGQDLTEATVLPEEYYDTLRSLPVLTEELWPSAEAIVAAEADCIATSFGGLFSSLKETYPTPESYNELGIKLFEVTCNASGKGTVTMDEYFDSIRAFGRIFDIQDAVNAYVDEQSAAITAYAGESAPSVLSIAYNTYGGTASWVKYPSSAMVNAILKYMGATTYDEEGVYDISAEGITQLDPDVVLISIVQDGDKDMTVDEFLAMPEISVLRAAQEGRVYVVEKEIPFNTMYNGHFNMLDIVEQLASYVYPEG